MSELPEKIIELIKAAEQGDAEAQFQLGFKYEKGEDVDQSDSTSVEWYRRAAEQGHSDAQLNLGWMYDKGRGVVKNENTTVGWYHKAAEQGHVVAQYNLGLMYEVGRGIEQSHSTAVEWYRKAAEQGDADAQFCLGSMYGSGKGVAQNDKTAVEWYRKAAEQGLADAQFNLGWMFEEGKGIDQSDSEAAEWYQKAAEQGDKLAQFNLGWMYEEGRGVTQDDSKAVDWYRRSAEQGEVLAQFNLAWMYEEGRGVTQDDTIALEWYRKASEQGNTHAQLKIGLMYLMGQGVEKSTNTGISLLREAHKTGNSQAGLYLGLLYMNGYGVQKSYARAQALFRKAAQDSSSSLRFQAIEYQDRAKRYALQPQITEIRERILGLLKVQEGITMTHYTSLQVGNALLLERSPLRLGHINALNDPNEGKLLWRHLGHTPIESKPAFVGCFLSEEDSLNMWRFYSKDHQKEDACGCAITFKVDNFFEFDLLSKQQGDAVKNAKNQAFLDSGKSPQESAAFYRVVYIKDEMQIHGEEENGPLKQLLDTLKTEVIGFLGTTPDKEKLQDLSWLLGPLPYLLKDADYEAEKEHRVIVTHLEYGAKEIQVIEPDLINGLPPRLYLELHRTNHLAPVKHVTLGPKSPHQEMMIPYWHHQLASKFPDQLKAKPDFHIKASRCAYQ
ncbi:SEL1-like repeat protein [Aeromonas veronii]|uniref:SEL1-like repeat protein n=1 Tax=Aeromonas veronii TaxID=654 RepID=UPI002F419FDB